MASAQPPRAPRAHNARVAVGARAAEPRLGSRGGRRSVTATGPKSGVTAAGTTAKVVTGAITITASGANTRVVVRASATGSAAAAAAAAATAGKTSSAAATLAVVRGPTAPAAAHPGAARIGAQHRRRSLALADARDVAAGSSRNLALAHPFNKPAGDPVALRKAKQKAEAEQRAKAKAAEAARVERAKARALAKKQARINAAKLQVAGAKRWVRDNYDPHDTPRARGFEELLLVTRKTPEGDPAWDPRRRVLLLIFAMLGKAERSRGLARVCEATAHTFRGLVRGFTVTGSITDDGARRMRGYPELAVLRGDTTVCRWGAIKLGAALARGAHAKLTTLLLRGNHLHAAGAVGLAKGLVKCALLTTMDLSVNGLGDEGAAAIGAALAHCKQLQCLDLQFNEIGDDGAVALLSDIGPGCTRLRELSLANNALGLRAAECFTRVWRHMTRLQTLNLRCNNLIREDAGLILTCLLEGTQRVVAAPPRPPDVERPDAPGASTVGRPTSAMGRSAKSSKTGGSRDGKASEGKGSAHGDASSVSTEQRLADASDAAAAEADASAVSEQGNGSPNGASLSLTSLDLSWCYVGEDVAARLADAAAGLPGLSGGSVTVDPEYPPSRVAGWRS